MSYKAGFDGPDAMRSKAEKMFKKTLNEGLSSKPSKSAVSKEKPRPYKKGGSVSDPNAELSRESRDHYPMPKKTAPSRDFKKGGASAKKKSDCYKKGGEVEGPMSGLSAMGTDRIARKKGGSVAHERKEMKLVHELERMHKDSFKEPVKKMAMGGAGKIRKNEMTESGKPIKPAKKPRKNGM